MSRIGAVLSLGGALLAAPGCVALADIGTYTFEGRGDAGAPDVVSDASADAPRDPDPAPASRDAAVDPDADADAGGEAGDGSAATVELRPVADSSVRSYRPDLHHGGDTLLQVGRSLANTDRALLRFDDAAIAARIGAGALRKATLSLTITTLDLGGHSDIDVEVHPLTMPWTEAGATWSCANDPTPDAVADCAPPGPWTMMGADHPWSPAVGGARVSSAPGGVVRVDVTAEVRRWLAAPASNHGVVLLLTDDPFDAWVNFRSREASTSAPVLSLDVDDAAVSAAAR